jgi:raffinose/stachyose/melibiose transport system permease protein
VTILNGVWMWNDVYVPLVFANQKRLQAVPLAILNLYGENTTNYWLIFAGVVMPALPVVVLYVLLTRQFIGGVIAGGVKG